MDLEEQYDKIFRYCCFKLYDRQLAQDMTQETFLRFYRQDLRLDSSKELAYLYTIAGNLCTDAFRKRTVYSLDAIYEETVGEAAVSDTSEELINSLALRAAIAKLPQEEQELLFLRYVNEVSVTSICKMTGMSRFAVYRRLSKTVKWLKEELKKEGFSE